jgi:PhzF family phenazine biosynthesis protein
MALEGLKKSVVTQETKAGILPVSILFSDKVDKVMMHQGKPIYKDIFLDISRLARSLRISKEDIDDTLPKQKVSTGLFTLPICIKSYDVLESIKPDFDEIKNICKDLGVGSFHLFTFDTLEPKSVYHARNFAPVYGVNEDPVTGTANGAVCSYLVKNKIVKGNSFVCEQGDIIDRPGRVFVEVNDESIRVGGRAVIVDEVEIEL